MATTPQFGIVEKPVPPPVPMTLKKPMPGMRDSGAFASPICENAQSLFIQPSKRCSVTITT